MLSRWAAGLVTASALASAAEPAASLLQLRSLSADLGQVRIEISL
jgi:hypothetical protein